MLAYSHSVIISHYFSWYTARATYKLIQILMVFLLTPMQRLVPYSVVNPPRMDCAFATECSSCFGFRAYLIEKKVFCSLCSVSFSFLFLSPTVCLSFIFLPLLLFILPTPKFSLPCIPPLHFVLSSPFISHFLYLFKWRIHTDITQFFFLPAGMFLDMAQPEESRVIDTRY